MSFMHTTITKSEALEELGRSSRQVRTLSSKLQHHKDQAVEFAKSQGITTQRVMSAGGAIGGMSLASVVDGAIDGRGMKPPLPVSMLVALGIAYGATRIEDKTPIEVDGKKIHVPNPYKDAVMMAATTCGFMPAAKILYGSMYKWQAKAVAKNKKTATAQISGVGYQPAPPQVGAAVPAMPAGSPASLARQLYALAS